MDSSQPKDQNQTVHDYVFDALEAEDDVTFLGADIDDGVRKIVYAYEGRGMLERVTSKRADDNVVDEVFRQFNEWGLVKREHQSHEGPVNTVSPGTNPRVDYAYEDQDNPLRLTSMAYPNGRVVTYAYDAGDDDALGRVTSIVDGDGPWRAFRVNKPACPAYSFPTVLQPLASASLATRLLRRACNE